MADTLIFGTDNRANCAYSPFPSEKIFSAKLTVGVAATVTLPADVAYWTLVFSYTGGSDVWVDFTGATAIAPTAGTFGATTSTKNPGTRTVSSTKRNNVGALVARTISLITTDAAAQVSVELWSSGINVIQ